MLATISDLEVDLGEREGNFDLTFGLWTNATYTETLPANTEINVPEKLYIGAFINTEGFYTRLDTCWATPSRGSQIFSIFVLQLPIDARFTILQSPGLSADENDATRYEFITSGCPAEYETVGETIEIFANGVAAQSQFALASFQFNSAAEAEIYLHCQV